MSDPTSDTDPHDDDIREFASSPCYLSEFESTQPPDAALIGVLNELIEGERAGAVGLIDIVGRQAPGEIRDLLDAVARDEARFCAMLTHHVRRLGGVPSRVTGAFAAKLVRRETFADQLRLLDKGQSVVVQVLEATIARTKDPALRQDLADMRDVHLDNIARCARLLADADAH